MTGRLRIQRCNCRAISTCWPASARDYLKTTLFEPHRYTCPELAELAAKEDIAEITLRRARRELWLI